MNKKVSAKRVEIVSLKMVREASVLYKGRHIRSPKDAAELVESFLVDCDREKFIVICLDSKNQPTNITTVSIGSLNASICHPREIFKVAILSNSAAVILAHNHPSGINTNDSPIPSSEDIEVTKRLVEAGEILGINVLDHIIIGCRESFISLKEKGLM